MAYNDVEILRDKNGNPIPQYYNVATGQFEPLTGENGATHTQLTGSYVEEVIQRNIHKSGQSRTLSIPDHIKGVNIETRIHGVTGTNPNFSILAYAGRIKLANILLKEEDITNPVRINFIFYPGASRGDAETLLTNEIFKVAGIPAYPSLYLALQINGSFEGDEGFDFEVNAAWLI